MPRRTATKKGSARKPRGARTGKPQGKAGPQFCDSAFASVCEQQQEAFAAQSGRDDWKPDPGDYDVEGVSLKTGTYEDKNTGETVGFFAPTARMVGDDLPEGYEGREFQIDFFTLVEKKLGFAKAFLAKVIGDYPEDLLLGVKEARKAWEGNQFGIAVKVAETVKGSFTNIYVNEAY